MFRVCRNDLLEKLAFVVDNLAGIDTADEFMWGKSAEGSIVMQLLLTD